MGLDELQDGGQGAVGDEMRTGLCGCVVRPWAGFDVEGSRPSASGTNANENWADLSERELHP